METDGTVKAPAFKRANIIVLEQESPSIGGAERNATPLSRNRDPNMTQNEHVYAIYSRPEEVGDVISGGNVDAVEGYASLNFEAGSISSFRENKN